MKILLIGNYPPAGQKSMDAFRRVLEEELSAAGHEVKSVHPERHAQRIAKRSRWRKWLGYIDMYVLFLPRLLWVQRGFDIVHICDHGNSMYVPFVWRRPVLVTCHDVIAMAVARGDIDDWVVGRTGRIYQGLIAAGLARADLIACVSDYTRRELDRLQIIDPARAITVHNGLNGEFSPLPAAEAKGPLNEIGLSPNDRYLLHVGSAHPRKNRAIVLELFVAALEVADASGSPPAFETLVFVGPPLRNDVSKDLLRLVSQRDVRVVDQVSHDVLRSLYSHAVALIFPSTLEGFGWPIIEAQAAGCPVIATDRAPMTEVGGDAAVYVDPSSINASVETLLAALSERSSHVARGLANAHRFTTGGMVEEYVTAYTRLATQP